MGMVKIGTCYICRHSVTWDKGIKFNELEGVKIAHEDCLKKQNAPGNAQQQVQADSSSTSNSLT